MKHHLKTWPDVFQPILDGTKTFEYRKDDRGYDVGDVLVLREWEPTLGSGGVYSGREITVRVPYLTRGPAFGIPEGYVVMSIKKDPENP